MDSLKDAIVPYITQKEIKDLVKKIARQIENDYQGQEVILVCALKGSILFIADLMRELQLPQRVDFVRLTGSKNKPGAPVQILKDISLNVGGKHVLIIEEIIDEAKTLSFLKGRILAANPASCKIVTLLDKPARRVVNLKPDYVGKTIEDRFVVGYGLDEGEIGRNYPDIYYLKH
ncbi:MAG TPA: hypoxanthine phosphoribosyltransferase [Bdellovibrionales bacterium]|nr:hypoxanthine phosphoribosyltransferase [Bdellovibrionales bacterium]